MDCGWAYCGGDPRSLVMRAGLAERAFMLEVAHDPAAASDLELLRAHRRVVVEMCRAVGPHGMRLGWTVRKPLEEEMRRRGFRTVRQYVDLQASWKKACLAWLN